MNFIINFGTYPGRCMFSIDEPLSSLKKNLTKLGVSEQDVYKLEPLAGLGSAQSFSRIQLIRLSCVPRTCQDYGTLVHEIWHVVHSQFKYIGITLSDDSEEAYAYFLDYLVENTLLEISKHKKFKKKAAKH